MGDRQLYVRAGTGRVGTKPRESAAGGCAALTAPAPVFTMRWERCDLLRLSVNDPFPDEVTQVWDQGTVSDDNITQHVSDDPDTAAEGDATVTSINYEEPSIRKQVIL